LRRYRLIGKRQQAEAQSAEAQGARGECKTHGHLLKRLLTGEPSSIAVACGHHDEGGMKLR
jgi:hypothetical protein